MTMNVPKIHHARLPEVDLGGGPEQVHGLGGGAPIGPGEPDEYG